MSQNNKKYLYLMYQLFALCIILWILISLEPNARAGINFDPKKSNKKHHVKLIPCDSEKNTVRISVKKVTALSFLENPKELVPGDGSFDFKRVQNDIFIKALSRNARTNLFVFVGSKRCRFNLVASEQNTDDLLEVREPPENLMEVKFNGD